MDRAQLLDFLACRIIASKSKDRPLKVGIDGRCAAGKTMLADELGGVLRARGFEVLRPSVDGFHHPRERRYRQGEYSARGYYQDAFNYQTVAHALLEPLSGDTFPVECRQVDFDYRTDLPVDAPPLIARANSILLFDGVFLFRREIDGFWDYRILVDIGADTSLARALIRDQESPPEVTRRKYAERYEPAWQIYNREETPLAKAGVIIDNRKISSPRILRREGAPPSS
jgi:uridine kinase